MSTRRDDSGRRSQSQADIGANGPTLCKVEARRIREAVQGVELDHSPAAAKQHRRCVNQQFIHQADAHEGRIQSPACLDVDLVHTAPSEFIEQAPQVNATVWRRM